MVLTVAEIKTRGSERHRAHTLAGRILLEQLARHASVGALTKRCLILPAAPVSAAAVPTSEIRSSPLKIHFIAGSPSDLDHTPLAPAGTLFFCLRSRVATGIANSSSLCPFLRAATSQRGVFPRPDHVSDGSCGFWYFGKTRGYFRRGARASSPMPPEGFGAATCLSRRSCSSRFSSWRFSDVNRIDNSRLISS